MTYKEFLEYEKELNEAHERAEIVHTGDSRIGNHSYSDWTDYYEARYNGKISKFHDGGTNRGPHDYDYNKLYALKEVGALDKNFPTGIYIK